MSGGPQRSVTKTAATAGVPDAPPRDWFLAAIECDGAVGACLDAVLEELGQRTTFIQTLQAALDAGSATGVDSITDLGARIRALETTLRFRLGVLRPERPAAWFRSPAATSTGPFQSTLLTEPVFAAYAPAEAESVRDALTAAWRAGAAAPLPFKDHSGCLWATLLALNAGLERVQALPAPFAGLRLDTLPDGMPPGLESRALRAFLLNVRNEVLATRERLAACFAELLATSEKLWAVQIDEARRGRTAAAPPAGGARARHAAADDLREEFKRRRRGATLPPFLTPADLDALKFMGFDGMPSSEALRQRYLAMAKRLHPDRETGSTHAFKVLTSAYSHLAGRVEATR